VKIVLLENTYNELKLDKMNKNYSNDLEMMNFDNNIKTTKQDKQSDAYINNVVLNNTPLATNYWQQCLDIIRDNIEEQAFNTWFLPLKAKSFEDNKLIIQIPSQWYQEWIEENYYNLLQVTVKRVLGENAKLYYETIVVDNTKLETDNIKLETAKIQSSALKYPPTVSNPSQTTKQNMGQNNLNPRYAFESFVVGNSNQLALSAAKAVATETSNVRFNPYFIYGGSGLGKTHLAQAIGNYVLRNNPSKRLLYVSSEQFTIDFVEQAISNDNKKKADFNNIYRNVDILIVDDIQFLSGKKETQNKFFHIFNTLHLEGKQIILTADRSPKDIKDIDDRLLSRFIAGLNVEIRQPDLRLRKEIIKKKSSDEGIILSEEIIAYIAKNVTKSVREIEGTLIKLIAMTIFDNKPLTLELVTEVVTGLASEQKPLTVADIKAKVGSFYGIQIEAMESKSRKYEIALARQMAMYFSRKLTDEPLKTIGQSFGGRDHSTVLHSCQVIENYLATNKKVKIEYETLEAIFNDR